MTTTPQLRQVQTLRFGTVTVQESAVITFVQPILGFESLQEFALFEHEENSPFQWLQSLEDPTLAFVVTNPTLFGHPYEFVLPQDACDVLNLQNASDAQVLTIVTIPEENPVEMTVNLLGPIVFHNETRLAVQLILDDAKTYGTKVRLVPAEALDEHGLIDFVALQERIGVDPSLSPEVQATV